jgi:hypothetical protein
MISFTLSRPAFVVLAVVLTGGCLVGWCAERTAALPSVMIVRRAAARTPETDPIVA